MLVLGGLVLAVQTVVVPLVLLILLYYYHTIQLMSVFVDAIAIQT